jgi:hypothetical protein
MGGSYRSNVLRYLVVDRSGSWAGQRWGYWSCAIRCSFRILQRDLLNNSNFGTNVTAGTFTLKAATGSAVTITVDPTTQSLNDIVTAINAQTGTSGITATIQND